MMNQASGAFNGLSCVARLEAFDHHAASANPRIGSGSFSLGLPVGEKEDFTTVQLIRMAFLRQLHVPLERFDRLRLQPRRRIGRRAKGAGVRRLSDEETRRQTCLNASSRRSVRYRHQVSYSPITEFLAEVRFSLCLLWV
jgi:hypothetical protein